MGFADKTLQCCDCGASFTFSAEEQEQFASRGYNNDPKRCQLCRAARKSRNERSSGGFTTRRQMYPAVCAECGKETEVPFQPREGRRVYCSRCYDKVRLNSRY